eukprot:s2181_g8.t1
MSPVLRTSAGTGGAPAVSADLWGLEGNGEEIYELDGKLRTDPASQRHLQLIKQAIIACWLVVLLFMVIATALIRLDMSLTGFEFRAAMVLVFAGPTLTALAAQQWRLHTVKGYEMVHLLAPLPYAAEAAWLMLLLYISKVQEQEGGATLPTGFRSVMYIDVFGWIKRARAQKEGQASPWEPRVSEETRRLPSPAEAAVPQPGRGPALDAVHYDGSILKGPAPRRPELLPGAAKPPPETLATKEMFDPTTFDIHPYLKPGVVPWRIFCSATTLLLVLWWISGVLVLLQSSGWSALRVSPLLHDSEEGPAPIEQTQTASFLLEQATIQPNPIAESLRGDAWQHMIPRTGPHLSCASADGAVRFAASSRFGLFEATLNTGLKSNASSPGNSSAEFHFAPVRGDALSLVPLRSRASSLYPRKDLSLICSGHDCHAQVLHRQGQRLASCALGSSARAPEAVMSLGDTWLGQGDAARDESQEEVSSLAMMDRCISGSERCAYAETTGGRLVELKSGLMQGSVDWLPTRVLLADVGRAAMRKGATSVDCAALHTLGDRYLAMLVTGGRELRIFDLRQSGKMVQRYPLPAQKRWSSMCSAGSNLYLLSEDRAEAAQIFRFPLPQSLLPLAQTKPAVLSEKVKAAPTEPPMTLASAYAKPKEEPLENAKASDVFGTVPLFAAKRAASNSSAVTSKMRLKTTKAAIATADSQVHSNTTTSSEHAVPIFAAKRVSSEASAAAPSSKPSAAAEPMRERRAVRKREKRRRKQQQQVVNKNRKAGEGGVGGQRRLEKTSLAKSCLSMFWDGFQWVPRADTGIANDVNASRKNRRLYLGNLPYHLGVTEDSFSKQLYETMRDRGMCNDPNQNPVLHVWFARDKGANYGFCEVASQEETERALQLDGMLVLGVPVSIKRPNDAVSPMGMIGGVPVGMQVPGQQASMLALPSAQVSATSPIIRIDEILKVDEKTTEDDYNDVKEDMQEGCGAHGKLVMVAIVKPAHASGNATLKPGDVYLQCSTTDDATKIMRAMGHRKYDGRQISMTSYEERSLSQSGPLAQFFGAGQLQTGIRPHRGAKPESTHCKTHCLGQKTFSPRLTYPTMAADRLATEARSFASYLASHLAFLAWLLWVFTPDERLQSWGITYYPDRWWGVALPVYVIPLAIFVFLTYNALNMLSACPLDSVNMYRDASTPLTDELFATAGDIPDLQDVSFSTVNRNTVLQRCRSIQGN